MCQIYNVHPSDIDPIDHIDHRYGPGLSHVSNINVYNVHPRAAALRESAMGGFLCRNNIHCCTAYLYIIAC